MTRGGRRVLDESGYRTAAIAWPESVPTTKVIRLPSSIDPPELVRGDAPHPPRVRVEGHGELLLPIPAAQNLEAPAARRPNRSIREVETEVTRPIRKPKAWAPRLGMRVPAHGSRLRLPGPFSGSLKCGALACT